MIKKGIVYIPQKDNVFENLTVKEVFKLHPNVPFARIPIYKDNIDTITGIVRRRDLHNAIVEKKEQIKLATLAKEATFVPENATADKALRLLLAEHYQLSMVVDEFGSEAPTNTKGYLVIRNPWPGMLLTLWGDDEKYKNVYWSKYPDCYYPGDYALKDGDGYLWLLGRADDILKIAGHRIGTAELESCVVSDCAVAESAVCGIPDEIKGEAIVVFAVLKDGVTTDKNILEKNLFNKIRTDVGPIATPKQIYFVSKLPKTRSGKIMRRLLKSIASGEKIGDVSTLDDPSAVVEIQKTVIEN